MDRRRQIFGFIVLFAVSVQSLERYVGETSIGKRQEYLDGNGKFLVEWEAYTDTQTIVFQLTAETTGFVGFGISPVGGMTGADIIIGGVYPNASRYFSVRKKIQYDHRTLLFCTSIDTSSIESPRSWEPHARNR